IRDLCNLVSKTFNITTFFINPKGEITYESKNILDLNPLYKNEKQNLFKVIKFIPEKGYDFPVIRSSFFLENYITISVYQKNIFEGTVLIGPSVSYPIAEKNITGFINDTQAYFYRKQVFQYYKEIPTIQQEKLIDISLVAFHMFNGILLSFDNVLDKNKESTQPIRMEEKINLSISKNLQTRTFHHDPIFEKKILAVIKEGRVEDIKGIFALMTNQEGGVLSKSSYIRSLKNLIIGTIAVVTRSAIEGGLPYEIAFTLSDIFIQRLEELNKVDEIISLAQEVLYNFTERVLQVKNERYSQTVTACKNYIFNHLYEEINHDDLATTIGLTPNYVSTLFKKEVGITISEYVQHVKIDEAKKLIEYSSTPISEICSLLNFTDQSYFTKVFKKHTGITPKQYREKHHLLEK
ncbi:helix-turn-helix domain-containing protein, partial [Neobacillus niacini]|uniref:helix-turn-helix domain-containing protein n=1 Tax=Neobacillus niacini TaxID=86668 RepID=UPI002FFFD0A5